MRLASVLEKIPEYCKPRRNISILRHKFFASVYFVAELKKLSSECEFETLHDSVIKDMIVCGTNDNS